MIVHKIKIYRLNYNKIIFFVKTSILLQEITNIFSTKCKNVNYNFKIALFKLTLKITFKKHFV